MYLSLYVCQWSGLPQDAVIVLVWGDLLFVFLFIHSGKAIAIHVKPLTQKVCSAFKVTRHLCFKNSKNLQLLDGRLVIQLIKQLFKIQQKLILHNGLFAELKARMSLGRRFLLFLKHRCLVTLRKSRTFPS